mmetsp:Transcript_16200/g.45752  ORF Transcript_16200/g.45752 Transcript_16200/m.45752 type:complete len:238 (-) Transcript_16200:215-928(-)
MRWGEEYSRDTRIWNAMSIDTETEGGCLVELAPLADDVPSPELLFTRDGFGETVARGGAGARRPMYRHTTDLVASSSSWTTDSRLREGGNLAGSTIIFELVRHSVSSVVRFSSDVGSRMKSFSSRFREVNEVNESMLLGRNRRSLAPRSKICRDGRASSNRSNERDSMPLWLALRMRREDSCPSSGGSVRRLLCDTLSSVSDACRPGDAPKMEIWKGSSKELWLRSMWVIVDTSPMD